MSAAIALPSPPRGSRRFATADLTLLTVAAVWGSSFLAMKSLAELSSPAVSLTLRYLVSSAALLVIMAVRRRAPTAVEWRLGALLGGSQVIILGLEVAGVARTSASNAGVLAALTALATPLIDGLWRRRWLPPSFFACACAAVVGVGLLVGHGGLRMPASGDGLILAAVAVRACHVTALGLLTERQPVDAVNLSAVSSLVGTVPLLAISGRELPAAAAELSPAGWLIVVYLGLACSVFAFVGQTWAIGVTSAGRAALLLGTEPVWALLAGLALAGDHVPAIGFIGVALVLGSTAVGSRIEARARASLPGPEHLDIAHGGGSVQSQDMAEAETVGTKVHP